MNDRVTLRELIRHYKNTDPREYDRCPIGEENFGRCELGSNHTGPHKKFDDKGNVVRMWKNKDVKGISIVGLGVVFIARLFLFAIVPAILTYLVVNVLIGVPFEYFSIEPETGMTGLEYSFLLFEKQWIYWVVFFGFTIIWGAVGYIVWMGGSWIIGLILCPSVRKYMINVDEFYEENYEKYVKN